MFIDQRSLQFFLFLLVSSSGFGKDRSVSSHHGLLPVEISHVIFIHLMSLHEQCICEALLIKKSLLASNKIS